MRWPIAAKLYLGFGVCVLLIALQAFLAIFAIGQAQNKTQSIMQTIPSTRETRDSVLQVVALESALRGYVATNDKSFILETDLARQQLDTDYTALEIYSHNHSIFKKRLDEATPIKDAIETALDRDLAAAQHGERASAIAGLVPLKKLVDQYQNVGPYIDDGTIGTPALFKTQFDDLVASQDEARSFLVWVGVIAAGVGIIWAFFLSNSLSKR